MRKVPPKTTIPNVARQKPATTPSINVPGARPKAALPASGTQAVQPQRSGAPPVYRPQSPVSQPQKAATPQKGGAPPVFRPEPGVGSHRPPVPGSIAMKPGVAAPPVYKP